MLRPLAIACVVASLAGCSGSRDDATFKDPAEELSYLGSLSNPTPAQWKRLRSLEASAKEDADKARAKAGNDAIDAGFAEQEVKHREMAGLVDQARAKLAAGDRDGAVALCRRVLAEDEKWSPSCKPARELLAEIGATIR